MELTETWCLWGKLYTYKWYFLIIYKYIHEWVMEIRWGIKWQHVDRINCCLYTGNWSGILIELVDVSQNFIYTVSSYIECSGIQVCIYTNCTSKQPILGWLNLKKPADTNIIHLLSQVHVKRVVIMHERPLNSGLTTLLLDWEAGRGVTWLTCENNVASYTRDHGGLSLKLRSPRHIQSYSPQLGERVRARDPT